MRKLSRPGCAALLVCLAISGCTSGGSIMDAGSGMISRGWDTLAGADKPEPAASGKMAAGEVAAAGDPSVEKFRRDLEKGLAGKDAQIIVAGSHVVVTLPSAGLFAPNAATLRKQGLDELNVVAARLKANHRARADVYGHTDDGGDEKKNLELTQARALSVARHLAAQGVDAKRLTVTGFGSARPVAANDTDEGRKANRRIEIQISAKGSG